jgi:hypothetical protein
MIRTVFASFENIAQARRAIRALRSAEFPPEDVTAYSASPILEPEFLPPKQQKSWISRYAIFSGFMGALTGYLVPTLTASKMNLPTGGKPIASDWSFGIVYFELTALGAIAGAVFGLLLEGRLPRLKGKIYPDEFADDLTQGGLVVSVTAEPPERLEEAERLLQEAGAHKVKCT